jgi:hypothetical protein
VWPLPTAIGIVPRNAEVADQQMIERRSARDFAASTATPKPWLYIAPHRGLKSHNAVDGYTSVIFVN